MTLRSGLGPDIRRRRRLLGITEKRVADALGVSIRQVGRWERGEDLPDPDQVRALVGLLEPPGPDAEAWTAEAGESALSVEIVEGPSTPSLTVVAGGLDEDHWSLPPERRISPPRLDRDALVVRREGRRSAVAGRPDPEPSPPTTAITPAIDRLLRRRARRDERRFRRGITAADRSARAAADAEDRLQAFEAARAARRAPVPPSPGRPIPPAPAGAANTGVVFPVPDTKRGSERVTFEGVGDAPAADDRLTYRARRIGTAAALVALGALLWWAMASLGDGFAAVLDLVRGTDAPAPDVAGLIFGR